MYSSPLSFITGMVKDFTEEKVEGLKNVCDYHVVCFSFVYFAAETLEYACLLGRLTFFFCLLLQLVMN